MAFRTLNSAYTRVRTFLVCSLIVSGILALVLAPGVACAQHFPILPVANSPHGIFSIFEDSKSRLWLGTIDDVYCFDGVNFYSMRQYGFPQETPNDYAEDSEGGIWIATQGTDISGGTKRGGLYRYQAGRVEKILDGNGLSIVSIAPGIMLEAVGAEQAAKPTYGDLLRINKTGDRWVATKMLSAIADHMTIDHGGNLLFPCPGGWCEMPQDAVRNWHSEDATKMLVRHTGDPLSERVLRDKSGCVWTRSEVHGSYLCPGDREWTQLPFELSQMDASAHLEEDSEGSVLMLVPFVHGTAGHLRGLMPGDIPADLGTALIGHDGTIWFGTQSGLKRMPYPFHLEYWLPPAGMTNDPSLIRRIDDRVYSAFGNIASLQTPSMEKWQMLPGTDPFQQNLDLIGLPGNRLLASESRGLAVYQKDTGKLLAGLSANGGIGRLAQTKDGHIWVSGDGIREVVIEGKRISLREQPIPQNLANYVEYDAQRDIVWGCDGKLLVFRKDGAWHSLSSKDGLLNADCGVIAIEPGGDLWVGYLNAAYALISNPTSAHPVVHNFTGSLDDVVANNSVKSLFVDGKSRVWMGNAAYNVASMQAAREGHWIPLTEQDGVGQPPVLTGYGLADSDGSFWTLSSLGVTRFSPPDDFTTSFPVPRISVSGFSSPGSSPHMGDAATDLPSNQQISAVIGTVQYDRRNALHFRYRILPGQGEWLSANDFTLPLGKFWWGTHTVQVQAQLSTGPWSEVAEQSFTVLRPVWLSWPVLLAFFAFGGTGAAGGIRWQKKRRERARKAFPDLGELRLSALTPQLQELQGELLDGRFEVGRILARGGFATVAEGRDMHHDGQPCAIKIFRQELVDKDWMARRFEQEVRALSKMKHPNVVRIYGSGTLPSGAFYLVMEFIDGATLRDLLDVGKLPASQAASYLRQIGSALDEIHANGVCHRDLKPENLMIRDGYRMEQSLVLIDFSIAIVKDPDETLHGLSRAAGTIYYMAPEQAIGYASSSTDIYSLAKIVIEMLTGRRLSLLLPDASLDLPDRVRELLTTLALPLSSPAIELLSSALEFDPTRRPTNAGAFASRVAHDLEMAGDTIP